MQTVKDMDSNDIKIAIILPAYNEASTIQRVVTDFHSILPQAHIYVINNCSTDSTEEISLTTLNNLACEGGIIKAYPKGKGNAVRQAFISIDADYYVLVDSDCTYSSQDLPKLLKPVMSGKADMVVGDRHLTGAYKKSNHRKLHNFGNRLVTRIINKSFGSNVNDVMSGYRVMTRELVKNSPILSEEFEVETELTLHCLDKNYRLLEVPIEYMARPKGSFSKLNTYRDGLSVLKTIFEIYRHFKPLQFFSIVSMFFFIAGLYFGIPVIAQYLETGIVLYIPRAILSTGLMIFAIISFAIGVILGTIERNNKFNYQLTRLHYREQHKR